MVRTAFLSAFALTLHGAAAAADTEALQPKPLSPHAIAMAKHKADLAMCNGHDVCKVVQCEAGYTRTPFCPTHGKQAGVKECRCHAEVALSGQLEVAVPAAQKGAAKLDSHMCRAKLEKESTMDWAKLSRPRNSADLMDGQQTYTTQVGKNKVTYVRNQKAASATMVQEFARAIGAPNHPGTGGAAWSRLNGYKVAPYTWTAKDPFPKETKDGTSKVIFTVVRDPLEAVVDGYLDIVKNIGKSINQIPGAHEWLHMDCKDPIARFSSFLDAVEAREPLGHQAMMAFPQAVRTNVVTPRYKGKRFDAVLKLEELHSGMVALGQMAGVQNVSMPPPNKHLGHANDHKSCANFDVMSHPDVVKRICDLYAVDYACLDYELPSVCKN